MSNNSEVQLKIYDILGNEIAVLLNEQLVPGTYEVGWDGNNLSSGVYYYRLSAGNPRFAQDKVLLKLNKRYC